MLLSAQEQSPPVEKVLSSLQVDLLVPYSQLLPSSQAELPDSCLAFGSQRSLTRWYIFSEAEQLRQTRTELTSLIQVREQRADQSTSISNDLAQFQGSETGITESTPCSSRQQALRLTCSPPTPLSSSPAHWSTPGSWRRVREPREAILHTSSLACPPPPPSPSTRTPTHSCQTSYPRVRTPAFPLSSSSLTDTCGC